MRYILLFNFWLLANSLYSYSQDSIVPTRLYLTTNYTTNLVFPYGIVKADVGSPDILLQKSGPMENVLLIKAGKKGFAPTNLSLYTKEGAAYSYQLFYADTLSVYIQSYKDQTDWSFHKRFRHRSVCQDGMRMELTGIYTRQGLLWMQFQVWNRSALDYMPGSVRFSICDRKRTRKMVVQEEAWAPSYTAQAGWWASGSVAQIRYGFAARVPDRKKEIVAEWADERGERRIRMLIPVRWLLQARAY